MNLLNSHRSAVVCTFRLRLLDGRPYTFMQVAGSEDQGYGGSYRNSAEALVVVDLLKQLQAQAQQHLNDHSSWCSADSIRIITFYQAQVALLKRNLREKGLEKVVVATVDSSQGCEADIVIVSFVRSANNAAGNVSRSAAGFLTDDRRMNVSLTRARHQLVCVGNAHQMMNLGRGAETLQLLARDAADRNVIQTFATASGQRQSVNAQLDRFYGSSSDGNRNKQQHRQQRLGGNKPNKKPRYGTHN